MRDPLINIQRYLDSITGRDEEDEDEQEEEEGEE